MISSPLSLNHLNLISDLRVVQGKMWKMGSMTNNVLYIFLDCDVPS